MALRVRYPKTTGQVYDALGIFDTYNQAAGILVAVRLFLGGSNTYSDPIPVADVDVIGGIPGGGGAGVGSLNGLSGDLTLAAGTGITVTPSGGTLTIAASGGGGGGVTSFNGRTGVVVPANNDYTAAQISGFAEAVDDRVAALLVEGENVTLTYDDGANTLTIAAAASGITDEQIDDRVNALIVVNSELTKNYDDVANELQLGVTNFQLLNTITVRSGGVPPASPNPGDIWWQESVSGGSYFGDTSNGTGQLTYGFYWWWDGARWRSPRLIWNSSAGNLTSASEADKRPFLVLPEAGLFNLFLARLKIRAFVIGTNNASNYWTLTLYRQNVSGSTTTITTVNTSAGAAATWLSLGQTINALLDVSATDARIFAIGCGAIGSPGALFFGSELTYFYVKP
jgi:hypothetical protein